MMKNKVKELRARFGYSQEKLGETVGVTRQTVAAIEKALEKEKDEEAKLEIEKGIELLKASGMTKQGLS